MFCSMKTDVMCNLDLMLDAFHIVIYIGEKMVTKLTHDIATQTYGRKKLFDKIA